MTVPSQPVPPLPADSQQVLGGPSEAAIFLVLTINAGRRARRTGSARRLSGLKRAVSFRIPAGKLSCVIGVGSAAWDRLFSGPRPAELHPFRRAAGRQAPRGRPHPAICSSTSGPKRWTCVSSSPPRSWTGCTGSVTVADEVYGFRYFDERDLLGFVDGTENPDGQAAGSRGLHRRRGPGLRRWKLRHRAEVPARPARPGTRCPWRSRSG